MLGPGVAPKIKSQTSSVGQSRHRTSGGEAVRELAGRRTPKALNNLARRNTPGKDPNINPIATHVPTLKGFNTRDTFFNPWVERPLGGIVIPG